MEMQWESKINQGQPEGRDFCSKSIVTADEWLAMIIPVAILAKTATLALSIRGLGALVHSQIARGNTNQNTVLCALTRRTE
jgi:hypothetical protein